MNTKSGVLFAKHGTSDVRLDVPDIEQFIHARPDALVSVLRVESAEESRPELVRRYVVRKDELLDIISVTEEPRDS